MKEKSVFKGKNCKLLPNTYKKQSGITLIALVITIVVLLILAGIMITYVLGDNGVIHKAQEAKKRTENAMNEEEEYMDQVGNMIDKYANGKGNVETNTPDPEEPADPTWQELNEIAKAIANDSSINENSGSATVTINGKSKTVTVGEIYEVKYGEEEKRVRVLGFKHDDLVDTSVYGGNHKKASISFEFLDFITGTNYMSMNSDSTNEGGWASTTIRTELNGSESTIGGLGANLSNKSYIKQVKKKYIETYSDAESVTTCNDYLWLLASSEIITTSNGYYSYAVTSEGNQYKYYQGVTETYDEKSANRVKKDSESGTASNWWLRSPTYDGDKSFSTVSLSGKCISAQNASFDSGVAPGFSI